MTKNGSLVRAFSAEAVVEALSRLRVRFVDSEYEIHDAVAAELRASGIPFEKEYRLGPRNRVDFFVPAGGVAVEIKKGTPNSAAVERQVERYCAYAEVRALVLVVQGNVFRPPWVEGGKPVHYISLARLWGVAI